MYVDGLDGALVSDLPVGRAAPVDEMTRFVESAHSCMKEGDADSVWNCEPLLTTGKAIALLATVVRAQLADLRDKGAGYGAIPLVPLINSPQLKLSAILVTPRTESTRFEDVLRDHAESGLLWLFDDAEVSYDLYEQQNLASHDVFDPAKKLSYLGRRLLRSGECVRIEAGRTLIDDLRPSRASLLVALYGPPKFSISWEYDAASLLPTRPYSSTLEASRMEYALAILAELGSMRPETSIERATSLLEHPTYFVRWRALHALAELSPSLAVEALGRFGSDEHPHVRSAARKTMHSLGESK